MFRQKNIPQLTEEDALAVAAALHEMLLPGQLRVEDAYLRETMDRLQLTDLQRQNLSNAYNSIADEEPELEPRIAAMCEFLGGDERAALALCMTEQMKIAADVLAVSMAEDINNRNAQLLPFSHWKRKMEKREELEDIRGAALDGLVVCGQLGGHEASLCLKHFEATLEKKLNELSGKTPGKGR